MEVPTAPDLVLKETAVGFLDPLRQVAEEYESRYHGVLQHRDIFYLDEFAFIAWGGSQRHLLKHIGIEL